MRAEIQTLQTIFLPAIQYQIPTFQRPYVWTEKDQWQPLWEDVRNTAQRDLDKRRRAGPGNDTVTLDHPHFLGAIVIQLQPPTGGIGKRDIIDGQQRLTTLQLLLDATQEVFEELNHKVGEDLSELVLNDGRLTGTHDDLMFKVWPTFSDREAFRHVMHNNPISHTDQEAQVQEKKIAKAHDFFKSRVREWVTAEPDAVVALDSTLRNHLHLVVIDLSMGDDPYVIFQTLNARGTPLLQADLIKTFILQEAEKRYQVTDNLHAAHLSKMEDSWWRAEQGQLGRTRIDIFLNHWIVMHRNEEVSADKVFSTFREYASNRPITSIAENIGAMASVYQRIQKANEDPILGPIIHHWRGSLAPMLMWLLSSEIPEQQLGRCLRIIESFLARRMIRNITAASYNKLFLTLLGELKKSPLDQADVVIVKFLDDQKTWGGFWPDDREMEHVFTEYPLYKRLRVWALNLVLRRIEEHLRGPLTEEKKVSKTLTIEHVMPQEWRAHWALPPETDAREEAEAERDRLRHTIGNLTLVTKRLNPKMSNAPWHEKRKLLHEHSVLELRKSLTIHDEWNEETIRARGRQLAKVAAEVWPHAEAWRKRLKA